MVFKLELLFFTTLVSAKIQLSWLGSHKDDLSSERFPTNGEVKEEVSRGLNKVGRNFDAVCMEKLVSCYQMCLENVGDYVEK